MCGGRFLRTKEGHLDGRKGHPGDTLMEVEKAIVCLCSVEEMPWPDWSIPSGYSMVAGCVAEV